MARNYINIGQGGELGLGSTGYTHGDNNWRGNLQDAEGNTPGPAGANDDTTRYIVGDTVVHNGSIWVALRGTTPGAPGTPDINDNVEPGGTFDTTAQQGGMVSPYWQRLSTTEGAGVQSILSPTGISSRVTFSNRDIVRVVPSTASGGTTDSLAASNNQDPISTGIINTVLDFAGAPLLTAADTGVSVARTSTREFTTTVLDRTGATIVVATVPIGATISLLRLVGAAGTFNFLTIIAADMFPTGTSFNIGVSNTPVSWNIERASRLTGDVGIRGTTQIQAEYNEDNSSVDLDIQQNSITTPFLADGAATGSKVGADIVTTDRLRDASFTGSEVQQVTLTGDVTNIPSAAASNEQIRFSFPNDFNAGTTIARGALPDIESRGSFILNNGRTPNEFTDTTADTLDQGYFFETSFRLRTVPGSILFSSTMDQSDLNDFDTYNTGAVLPGVGSSGNWSSINSILIAPTVAGDSGGTLANDLAALTQPNNFTNNDELVVWIGPSNWAVYRVVNERRLSPTGVQSDIRVLRVAYVSSIGTFQATTPRQTHATDPRRNTVYRPVFYFRGNGDLDTDPVGRLQPAEYTINIDTAGAVFNAGDPFNITNADALAGETVVVDPDNNNSVTLTSRFSEGANAFDALREIQARLVTLFGPRMGENNQTPDRVVSSPPIAGTGEFAGRVVAILDLNRRGTPDLDHNFTVSGERPHTGQDPIALEVNDGADVQDSIFQLRTPDGSYTASFNTGTSETRLMVANRIAGLISATLTPGATNSNERFTATVLDGVPAGSTTIAIRSFTSTDPGGPWTFQVDHTVGANSSATTGVSTSRLPVGTELVDIEPVFRAAVGGTFVAGLTADTPLSLARGAERGYITGVPEYPQGQDATGSKYVVNISDDGTTGGRAVTWDEEFINSTRSGTTVNLATQTPADTLSIRGVTNFEDRPTLDGDTTTGGAMFFGDIDVNDTMQAPAADTSGTFMTHISVPNREGVATVYDTRVRANETANLPTTRPALRHLRIGGTVYDIPTGDSITAIELRVGQDTTPTINAYAAAQRLTFTADADNGLFDGANLDQYRLNVPANVTVPTAFAIASDNMTGTFTIEIAAGRGPNDTFPISLVGPIIDSNGETHTTTAAIDVNVVDARPAITFTPREIIQDRRFLSGGLNDTNDFTVNFGTVGTGTVAAGTLNAFATYTIQRRITTVAADGTQTPGVFAAIPALTDQMIPTTGTATLSVDKYNISDIDDYRVIVVEDTDTNIYGAPTPGAVQVTLRRILGYSYGPTTDGQSVVNVTQAIQNGQTITVSNSGNLNVPLTMTVPIEAIAANNTSFHLITPQGNILPARLRRQSTVQSFRPNRLAEQNDQNDTIAVGQWQFAEIPAGALNQTYTIGGLT